MTNESEGEPIYFPCLHDSGCRLLASDKNEFIEFRVRRALQGNRFLLKNYMRPIMSISFVIGRDGKLRRVVPISVRRLWAKKLLWFVDLVDAECEIAEGKCLKVKEFLEVVSNLRSPPGFSTAGQFKGFLRKQPQDSLFDGTLFRLFWEAHCPKIAKEKWNEQYP